MLEFTYLYSPWILDGRKRLASYNIFDIYTLSTVVNTWPALALDNRSLTHEASVAGQFCDIFYRSDIRLHGIQTDAHMNPALFAQLLVHRQQLLYLLRHPLETVRGSRPLHARRRISAGSAHSSRCCGNAWLLLCNTATSSAWYCLGFRCCSGINYRASWSCQVLKRISVPCGEWHNRGEVRCAPLLVCISRHLLLVCGEGCEDYKGITGRRRSVESVNSSPLSCSVRSALWTTSTFFVCDTRIAPCFHYALNRRCFACVILCQHCWRLTARRIRV